MEEITKDYKYEIGGVVYEQKKLVLGQISQIMNLLKEVNIPSEATALNLMTALGDKLSQAIAVVLHKPDVKLKDKNIKEIASEIEFEMSPDLTLEVIEDFFDLTPISSLLEKVGNTVGKIADRMKTESGSTP